MKYKCITKCFIEDSIIMNPGDIIMIGNNQLYNVSTGVDYRNITDMEKVKFCLEAITDDCSVAPKTITDSDRFKEITQKMCDIFERKNHDYGNSFEQSLNEEGLAASRIRMGDKWNRFKSLSKPRMDSKVKDESLRDTLLDMSVYCILTIMWLDKNS